MPRKKTAPLRPGPERRNDSIDGRDERPL